MMQLRLRGLSSGMLPDRLFYATVAREKSPKGNVPIMGFLQRSGTERGVRCVIMPRNAYSLRSHVSAWVKDRMRNPFRRKSKKTEEAPKQA